MALQYLFDPNKQFQSIGGVNEVGGFLRVFLNGTDDRATTYRNFDGGLNEPDIVLDTYGRAVVIVDDTKTYRIDVYNRLGGLMWTVSNYKARGGSGGGSGTPVRVEGTAGEIDVDENTVGGVKHFVVGLASTIKNAIATLTMAVNGLANALNGKKDRQTPVSVAGGTTKTLTGISQDSDGVMTPEFDDIEFPDYSQRFNNIENEQAVDAKVIASALNDLNSRMESVEASQGEKNIGDRTADSLDAQALMVGGIPVKLRQAVKNFLGSATKTITGLSQNANGEITPVFSDIDFDSKVLSFFPQSLGYMTPDERAALNAKMQEVAYSGGMIVLWDGLGANFPCVLSYYSSSEYYFYRVEKYVNRIEYFESIVTYDSITKTFNVDQSSTTIDSALYEKVANKKTTITGNETSITYYPNMKAVVDYINGVMQNLGGKLITDNGDTFTDSSDLPSTTPYGGVDIADKDYAYIQNTGTAERWSATVSGSSVTWQQEYAISIPVFTPNQQAAIDSGATSTKVGDYDAHLADTNNPHGVTAAQVGALTPTGNGSNVTATFTAAGSRENISTGEKLSVIFGKIAKWFTDLKALAFKDNVSDSDISGTIADTHIASASTWNDKQNTINDLAEIRSGAAAGATALQSSGNGSNVTSTFTAASSRTNISSGENLSTIFGKIAKWFGDLKAVAFSGSYNDLSDKPTIPNVNNGTLTIKQNNSVVGTFTANQSNNVDINLTNTTYGSLTPSPASDSVSLCTRGEKFTWGTTGSQLQVSRETKSARYIDIGTLHNMVPSYDVEGVAHFTIVGKLSTWANENNSVQFRADVCVEFRSRAGYGDFETSRIYGRILYKGNSSQLSNITVVTTEVYHTGVYNHYDLVISLSIPNASNNYTRIAVESFYAMNSYVGEVDGIAMEYTRDITIHDSVPTGRESNQSYELPTL